MRHRQLGRNGPTVSALVYGVMVLAHGMYGAADDFRGRHPRFRAENLQRNVDCFAPLRALAKGLGITPTQLALARLLHQGDDIVPIPGTKRRRYLEENVGAQNVTLTRDDLASIDRIIPPGAAAGTRYPEPAMRMVGI